MKNKFKIFTVFIFCFMLVFAVMLSACGGVYITGITQTEGGITVTYSDGTTETVAVGGTDGVGVASCEVNDDGELVITYTDGTSENVGVVVGSDGAAGADGSNAVTTITIEDVWEYYCETVESVSYEDFLTLYLSYSTDSGTGIAKALTSSVKVYTEFIERYVSSSWGRVQYSYETAMYTGSGVIWKIDSDYVYFVTNYHVVYDTSAYYSYNGNSYFARAIYLYLYGSEDENYPVSDGTGSDGYTAYNYGDYAVECTLVGASVTCDIAVLRASRSDVEAVNDGVQAVELADGYYVGETAIAVGNAEDYGISVTQGIVSVDAEYIELDVDGTTREYRSLRIDTALYSGNSGGGLFNSYGQLIGINNAGMGDEGQNINYAIPLEIVQGAVENILCYCNGTTLTGRVAKLGITVTTSGSKYVYNSATGYGSIYETITVYSVNSGSIAETLALASGDILTAITVNGTEYTLKRSFNISDILLNVRADDVLTVTYTRDGASYTSAEYTVSSSDMSTLY